MHSNKKTRCRNIATIVLLTCLLALTPNANGQKFRYHGTNLSDFAILSSPTGGGTFRWIILKNENPAPTGMYVDIPFGVTTDIITNQGNWNGDAAHELALFRNGTYFTSQVNGGAFTVFNWGLPTDMVGTEGDYDGDGRMDYTIVRAPSPTSPLQWWVLRSSDSTSRVFEFGTNATDLPLAGADYTGDGTDDPCVARIGAGGQLTWIWGTTSGAQLGQVNWGDFDVDFIVPGGDYDGDGKADFMVWRGLVDGVWYLLTSSGTTSYLPFGIPGGPNRDRPMRAGDYDGDGKTDIAIYRPTTRTFWINRSTGGVQTQVWGVVGNNNLPVASYGIF